MDHPTPPDLAELLGPELASALAKKGYDTLTPVQRSVLAPELSGRDLRISSQTGSGKTLAIGFVLREVVAGAGRAKSALAQPRALVVVPTRELAKQVHDELGWLYAPLGVRIASVAGGASYRDEHRALARGPAVVVGTPGRLLDHLTRGGIDTAEVAAVVLDEADRMLDLGFREELESILAALPEGHRTHLVSATFARDVAELADQVQEDAVRIEATPAGGAHADIDHVVYLVTPRERVDALVNVLLHHAEDQTLIFARTRADVADVTRELTNAGFAAGSLSGEMQQQARNRALEAFKRGEIRALVATDVAARGIDVQDIARVVQIDPPSDPETYVHRSGRTGRAGRKGTSALLVPPSALRRATSLLQRAGVRYRVEAVPTARAIRAAQDQKWFEELTRAPESEAPERIRAQVERILEEGLAERALSLLLTRVQKSIGEPREVTPISVEPERGRRPFERAQGAPRRAAERGDVARWVPFRITWGEAHGADPRRLVAMLCRRGGIRGSDIGAIQVNRHFSNVEVSERVAEGFARATREPDPRDPRVAITPFREHQAPRAKVREHHAPSAKAREQRAPAANGREHHAPSGRPRRPPRGPKPGPHGSKPGPHGPKPGPHGAPKRGGDAPPKRRHKK